MPDTETSASIAAALLPLWRGEPASLVHVADSEHHVYSFTTFGRRVYLRLTSQRHRTREQIVAELDFVIHLHNGGARVSSPVRSIHGRMLESVGEGEEAFTACVFEEARGEVFEYGSDAEENRTHFRARGRALGRIHTLSRSYVPAVVGRRFRWDEDPLLARIEAYLPASEEIVRTEHRRLMDFLRGQPESPDRFGLIHGDPGAPNLRCRGQAITFFDFNDCCYHWYAYDLAIVIYPHGWRDGAGTLLDALLEGYAEEAAGNVPGRNDIVEFCRLRLLYLFLVNARKWGFADLSPEQTAWYNARRENIARGYILHQ